MKNDDETFEKRCGAALRRKAAYEVAVHLCDLPSNKTIGRAIGRYLNTGRYTVAHVRLHVAFAVLRDAVAFGEELPRLYHGLARTETR
ncbi:MAG: hypothetical protein SOX74_05775 [Candidatus Faecousia sp.]|uniref:hypothetical protein n=1 Tax=Faecousia sp. TaxID=2952921 RepID=UPI002A8BCDA4|nr:hypothetical protein [Candidatus Faecousia sp.]